MKETIKQAIKKRIRLIYQITAAIACATLIIYVMPRDHVFKYHFELNKPWGYGQLMSNFNFNVNKSSEQLTIERDSICRIFEPYFNKEMSVAQEAIKEFEEKYHSELSGMITYRQFEEYRNRLNKIYEQGIISNRFTEESNTQSNYIRLITDNKSSSIEKSRFLKAPEAYLELTRNDTIPRDIVNRLQLESFIRANIIYDSVKSVAALKEQLEGISTSDDIVMTGEKIIDRGDIVDSKTYRKLQSYQDEQNKRDYENNKTVLVLIGQIIFVITMIFGILSYIYVYCTDVYNNNNKYNLFLLSATIFPVLTGLMIRAGTGNVFMLPYAMIPMLLCLFTTKRTALFTHIFSIMLCSMMLTSQYEFLILQIAAGHAAILSMRELSSRSQMFRCVFFVFASYAISYLCYELIIENDITKINPMMYVYFIINAILMLFAYPLMFVIEKLFGFVSNVTLIEISNINSELLRKLSEEAPGTFQHSMQVGNLAAEAARKIGANSLEVRTGALYHDIGKLNAPIYFTENQSGGFNPHSTLSLQESAKIIIKHVTDGVALAEKHHLPSSIVEFIKTHHGLGKTGYFYITYMNEHPDEEIDESAFTYPGPNPSTKEQAVLMLADCVEAASHSLKEYTEENINELVNNIVDKRLQNGELNMCPITFRDIETIKDVFKNRLKAIYHTRISYPTKKQK